MMSAIEMGDADCAKALLALMERLFMEEKRGKLKTVVKVLTMISGGDEPYIEDMECCMGEVETVYLSTMLCAMKDVMNSSRKARETQKEE